VDAGFLKTKEAVPAISYTPPIRERDRDIIAVARSDSGVATLIFHGDIFTLLTHCNSNNLTPLSFFDNVLP
jgi:hypothetical protein